MLICELLHAVFYASFSMIYPVGLYLALALYLHTQTERRELGSRSFCGVLASETGSPAPYLACFSI
jgi:hypothetical protein